MKAWRLSADGTFGVEDVPEPVSGAGDFVVDVHAVGMCHSDVGIIDGPGRAWIGRLPMTLGHEVSGVVSAVGPQAGTGVKVGDRVALIGTGPQDSPPGASWDGGPALDAPGVNRDGGYAAKVIGRAHEASYIPVPDNVSFEQAAVATDMGMTAHHAVIAVGGVRAALKVGIIGLGGLGATGARIAVLAGAEVYAAEPKDEVRDAAVAALGVKGAVRDVLDLAGLDLDVIVDFAGVGTTTAGAIEVIGAGGRIVQVGLGRVEATINTSALCTKELTLVGSLAGDKSDVAAVLGYIAAGQLAPALEIITFDQIGEAIQRLRAGQVTGRFVARIRD
jgi:alcohol dehydrogenase, propanol-preferring